MRCFLILLVFIFSCTEKKVSSCGEIKYNNLFQKRHFQTAFFDYEQALCVSGIEKKPLLVVMGGWGVARLNRLEENIFSQQEVANYIDENYITVHLYTDDKTLLPYHEQYNSKLGNGLINTIGKKNVEFQTLKFQTGSQPYISILGSDGSIIISEIEYTDNVDEFLEELKSVVVQFR